MVLADGLTDSVSVSDNKVEDTGGKPALRIISAVMRAVKGVNSEGFMTMVFPVARAGPNFQHSIKTGQDKYNAFDGRNRERTYEGSSMG